MPEPPGKRDAQERADKLRVFREQLEELERDRILVLTDEQRTRLNPFLDRTLQELAREYDVDISASQKQLSLGMRIISALGGLALCAAVFLFFYRYWGSIATTGQVAILIATPLLGLAAMHFTAQRERTLYFTSLIGLVVFASFVLNLYVLGQIFNLVPTPNAFLAWGALGLVLGYTYGLRLPLAMELVALAVFFSATILSWTGAWWDAAYRRPELGLIAGATILAVPILIPHTKREGLPSIYRLIGLLIIFICVLGLWASGNNSFLPFDATWIERSYQVVAFVIAAAAIWLGIRHNLPGTVNLGAAAFTIFLFIKFVNWWWDWMPRYLFFFIVGAIAIGLLIAFRRIRKAAA